MEIAKIIKNNNWPPDDHFCYNISTERKEILRQSYVLLKSTMNIKSITATMVNEIAVISDLIKNMLSKNSNELKLTSKLKS